MGLIQSFFNWQAQNYQKRVDKMREQGLCPDCRGRGFNEAAMNAYMYLPSYDYSCPSCNGTGSFSDWEMRDI